MEDPALKLKVEKLSKENAELKNQVNIFWFLLCCNGIILEVNCVEQYLTNHRS